ncbi:ribonuclease VapC [Thermoplasmatales archaeon AK]|nr:ribonuclease VapC [Thermoplasmatales archaeon AK]
MYRSPRDESGRRFVLDTSAILGGITNLTSSDFIVPESVIGEIRRGKLSRDLDLQISDLSLYRPSANSLKKVRQKAIETGDIGVLSQVDLDVISSALETGSSIISDDYAIQNVAAALDVPFVALRERGIMEVFRWAYKCSGCGRRYKELISECPVCGHKLRRTRKAN